VETVQLAEVAAVLADPSRSAMCLSLIDGRAWTVGELARTVGVAPSTASEHVARLREAGFVELVRQGRHHYVRIADPAVAELVERLATHAKHRSPRGLRASVRARRLAYARTCYDHLAGALGVAIRDGMIANNLLDTEGGLALTESGSRVLADLGVRPHARPRRPLLRECLDWTERREHLGGAFGAALLDRALDAGWVARDPSRAVRVQPSASEPLAVLGVDVDTISPHVEPA
jgi:DNA-binding transcriptional ArsR family regulator